MSDFEDEHVSLLDPLTTESRSYHRTSQYSTHPTSVIKRLWNVANQDNSQRHKSTKRFHKDGNNNLQQSDNGVQDAAAEHSADDSDNTDGGAHQTSMTRDAGDDPEVRNVLTFYRGEGTGYLAVHYY